MTLLPHLRLAIDMRPFYEYAKYYRDTPISRAIFFVSR